MQINFEAFHFHAHGGNWTATVMFVVLLIIHGSSLSIYSKLLITFQRLFILAAYFLIIYRQVMCAFDIFFSLHVCALLLNLSEYILSR